MYLARFGSTVFFSGCSLYIDGKYYGCCSGSVEGAGGVVRCVDGGVELRLIEDGYVVYEGGRVEVGLLRDVGGWVDKKVFEDGAIYIYTVNMGGNGVFTYLYSPYMDATYNIAVSMGANVLILGELGSLWSSSI